MSHEEARRHAQRAADATRTTWYVYSIRGDYITHPKRTPPTPDAVYSCTATPTPNDRR